MKVIWGVFAVIIALGMTFFFAPGLIDLLVA